MENDGSPSPQGTMSLGRALRWLPLILGLAVLVTVIFSAKYLSEEREFVRLVRKVQPLWLVLAFCLQTLTYVSQASIWRVVARKGECHLSLGYSCKLSLSKLFLDQTVPSAGISGTILVADALEKSGIPRPVVVAAAVISIVSYHSAFMLALAAALAVAAIRGHATSLIVTLALVFVVLAVAVVWLLLAFATHGRKTSQDDRVRPTHVRRLLQLIREADVDIVRDPKVMVKAVSFQAAIILLDTATTWVLIFGLGSSASIIGVFSSYVLSVLFRTFTFVPGGIGTFEAASVITLNMIGVAVPVALSATLLFRFLSFWLPMLPGMFCSRRLEPALRGQRHVMKKRCE